MCITNPVSRRSSFNLKAPPHALLGGFKPGALPPLPRRTNGGGADYLHSPDGTVARVPSAGSGVKRGNSTSVNEGASTITNCASFGNIENCMLEKSKSPSSSTQFYLKPLSSGNSTRTDPPSALVVNNHGVQSSTEDTPTATIKESSPVSISKPPLPAWLKDKPESKPKQRRRRKPQKPGKTAMMNDRHFVKHNYHDHGNEPYDFSGDGDPCTLLTDDSRRISSDGKRRGGVVITFPQKLHQMLDQIEADGLASVISWQPHGRAFIIHRPKEFTEHVMPKYFRQTKLTSFQRQLNLYGFARLTRGADNGAYYHELFLRGRPKLGFHMTRTKVKGTGFKAASSPDSEPDFYAMKPVAPPPSKVSVSSSFLASLSDGTPPQLSDGEMSDNNDSSKAFASSQSCSSVSSSVHSIEVEKQSSPLQPTEKVCLAEKAPLPSFAVLGQPQITSQDPFPYQTERSSESSSLGGGSDAGSPSPEIEAMAASLALSLTASSPDPSQAKADATKEAVGDFGAPRTLQLLDPFLPIPFKPDRTVSSSSPSSSHYCNATRTKDVAVDQSVQSTTSTTAATSHLNQWHGNCDFAAEVLKNQAAKSNNTRKSFTSLWSNKKPDECLPLMASSSSGLLPIPPVQKPLAVYPTSSSASRSSFAGNVVPPSVCPSSSPAASLALLGESGARQARCDAAATTPDISLRPRPTPRTVSTCSEGMGYRQGCSILDEIVNELLLSGNEDLMSDFVHDWNPIQHDVDVSPGGSESHHHDDDDDDDEEMSDAILGRYLDEFLK